MFGDIERQFGAFAIDLQVFIPTNDLLGLVWLARRGAILDGCGCHLRLDSDVKIVILDLRCVIRTGATRVSLGRAHHFCGSTLCTPLKMFFIVRH